MEEVGEVIVLFGLFPTFESLQVRFGGKFKFASSRGEDPVPRFVVVAADAAATEEVLVVGAAAVLQVGPTRYYTENRKYSSCCLCKIT